MPETPRFTDLMTDLLRPVLETLSDAPAASGGEAPARRQPVHTVAGGPHLFGRDTVPKLGGIALDYLNAFLTEDELSSLVVDPPDGVLGRVRGKLEREPIECFVIDFEDGFGARPDAEEDEAAEHAALETAAAMAMGSLPPSVGIRIKALDAQTGRRGLRTLELFLTRLTEASGGDLPPSFFVMLPKVEAEAHVSTASHALELLESRLGLTAGSVALELMAETPRAIVGADGRLVTRALVRAGEGRCTTVHLGALDLTGAAGVSAGSQGLGHPLCDVARQLIQLSLAGEPVALSDGVTHKLPIAPHRPPFGPDLSAAEDDENRIAVHAGWRTHIRDIDRSIHQGFYQSWDLHPAQLVSRFLAVYAHFGREVDEAGARLTRFLGQTAQATLTQGVFDDEATGRGLINFFRRGVACGAIPSAELDRYGLDPDDLAATSFRAIVERRGRDRA